MSEGAARWRDALRAVELLAADPVGLGGIALRARPGPARDALLARLAGPLPIRRLPVGASEEALSGGLDVGATLAAGRPVRTRGLASDPALLILPMAERADAALAGRLAQLLDAGRHALVALDEGAEPEERLAPALADRLAFHIDLDGLSAADRKAAPSDEPPGEPVDDPAAILAAVAARLGIASLRAPVLALRAARAAAALAGRAVHDADLRLAAALVLAPRATVVPETEADEAPEAEAAPEAGENEAGADRPPEDAVIEAIAARLPAGLLATLAGRADGSPRAGAGAPVRGGARGRPLPARQGRPDGRARIDLVATLRAAAPWQRIRGATDRPAFRASDIRLRRRESRSERLLIFAVDASGSTAMARLAEAKGAVERLLGEAYAHRDRIALIGFRKDGAEVLLPPTRALAQAKRRLSALPGGGGTPLAAGLREALALALAARRRGMAPNLILLTDGRANVDLAGRPGRAAAAEDAGRMARVLRAKGVPGLVIDAGIRPSAPLADLAATIGARHISLPRADGARIGAAVRDALA